ncbi:DUF805 domain-containing protein [Acidipropionibacterium jensenii]|uniref:DUF805 domain-containing protein n=1 Tax=Acidipropionibacterium jensenii TaxID=1749 RepID=A0A3T0RYU3_9ACTN|nr:DUF805 domain-containing protein [Acidipropionibacterium jensenii]AZZ39259.1 DUF805 domain-containing protein [Acidipropionibacterium jensenii]
MTNPPLNPDDPNGQQPPSPYDQYAGAQDPYSQNPHPQDPYQQGPYQQNPYGAAGPAGGRPRPSVTFQQAIQLFFKNYAVFNGRASRSEYWWVALFTFLVNAVLNGLARSIGDSGSMALTVVSSLWSLAILVPSLAICWRRLHDTGRPGGWFFIVLIPIVGWIILIVFLAGPSRQDAWQRFDNGTLPVES